MDALFTIERDINGRSAEERGPDRAAAMATLIMTAKLNDVDPQAWLADVLAHIADKPQSRIAELLPWNWNHPNPKMSLEQGCA
jgi:transposase